MSLDVYAKIKGRKIPEYEAVDGMYRFWSTEERYTHCTGLTNEVFRWNITHNLGTMASKVPTLDTTLYMILWRPDEVWPNKKEIKMSDLTPYLKIGLEYMAANWKKLKKYNPNNYWGHYNNLYEFVCEYYRASLTWPNAVVEISR